jgi:opacity protein-like surface antigen
MLKLSKIAGPLSAMAILVGGANAALADGMAAKRGAAVATPTSWSGFYFGVGSGYQWSSVDVCVPGTTCGFGQAFSVDHNTPFVTAFGGVQHQFGLVVLGVEGGWMSTFRSDWGDVGNLGCAGATTTCEARLNDILTIGGRLGWAAGHWMPYFTGGYASARFEQQVRTAGILQNTAGARAEGWYVGGGFEWTVTPGWAVGLEYRHYEFDDSIGPAYTPAGAFVNDRRFDTSSDTINARVSWKFDIPGRGAPARPLK